MRCVNIVLYELLSIEVSFEIPRSFSVDIPDANQLCTLITDIITLITDSYYRLI